MSDYHDLMHPGVTQFAYLKCPSKVRAALINSGGPRLPVEVIERTLKRIPSKVEGAHIGEPTPEDEPDFRVRGLVAPPPFRRGVTRITDAEREEIARLAADMKDRNPDDICHLAASKKPMSVHSTRKHASVLIERVCERMEIPQDVFFSVSRVPYLVAARSLVVKILRDRNPAAYSYVRVTDIIGRKDHTTAINLYHQFEKYRAAYSIVARLYEELTGAGK